LLLGSFQVFADSDFNIKSDDLQQKNITGRVVDASNIPLVGVNVVENGTTNGVMTGIDGKFSITVTSGTSVLKFSFIGYVDQEVAVGNQTTFNITLIESIIGLEEVVVVGYGTQRREAVTGSVASMSGDKIRDVPSSNITQALQGRVSGVDMEQTSTKPGATMQIRIRGTRSLNASNDPLVVLDGIPFAGSIGDISTSDIKSIDILKDAAATAIYGSRGANGVILLTTNKGLKGQRSKVTYNGYYGVKNIFAQYPMMNGPEFRALRTAANMYPIDGADESDAYNTNWQDLFYRTGAVTSHDLGVSGGTEKGNYNFGIGYLKDEAIIPGQDYSRF
jgi:TonB-linked SusC/RagA family outer membrane protein